MAEAPDGSPRHPTAWTSADGQAWTRLPDSEAFVSRRSGWEEIVADIVLDGQGYRGRRDRAASIRSRWSAIAPARTTVRSGRRATTPATIARELVELAPLVGAGRVARPDEEDVDGRSSSRFVRWSGSVPSSVASRVRQPVVRAAADERLEGPIGDGADEDRPGGRAPGDETRQDGGERARRRPCRRRRSARPGGQTRDRPRRPGGSARRRGRRRRSTPASPASR